MGSSAKELSWSAVNPGRDLPVSMGFCSAVFDLTDDDHREKYNELMALTRNVVGGEFKPSAVQIKEYDGKWVADGRYFVMVQWFQTGASDKFIPEKGPVRVRIKSHEHDPDS